MYQHRTQDKIRFYLDYIGPQFDEREVVELIREAYRTRNEIAHEFGEDRLRDNQELTFKLQKLLMFIILDLLDISADLQQRMSMVIHEDPEAPYAGNEVAH